MYKNFYKKIFKEKRKYKYYHQRSEKDGEINLNQ